MLGLRPSMTLYHDIRLAVAIMIRMPNRLMAVWISGPPDHSLMTNCPAKAKNTPRQKISSECWPQRMAGCRNGDFKSRPIARHEPHRDRGERQEMRKAQHVEIGLVDRIHPVAQPSPARNARAARNTRSSRWRRQTPDRRRRGRARSANAARRVSRCAPPSAHQAPNTNNNCQANGLKNQTPFG